MHRCKTDMRDANMVNRIDCIVFYDGLSSLLKVAVYSLTCNLIYPNGGSDHRYTHQTTPQDQARKMYRCNGDEEGLGRRRRNEGRSLLPEALAKGSRSETKWRKGLPFANYRPKIRPSRP